MKQKNYLLSIWKKKSKPIWIGKMRSEHNRRLAQQLHQILGLDVGHCMRRHHDNNIQKKEKRNQDEEYVCHVTKISMFNDLLWGLMNSSKLIHIEKVIAARLWLFLLPFSKKLGLFSCSNIFSNFCKLFYSDCLESWKKGYEKKKYISSPS